MITRRQLFRLQPKQRRNALEGRDQGPEDVSGRLAQRGEVGPDEGEVGDALLGTEAPRGRPRELGHADVARGSRPHGDTFEKAQ